MNPFEIGVCSWVIDRHDVMRSLGVAAELGFRAVQIGFFTRKSLEEADAEIIVEFARRSGLTIVGTFLAFEGEDYSSIERIAATGGFGWDEAYDERRAQTVQALHLTRKLAAPSLAVHAGTLPEGDSPHDQRLIERVREAADVAQADGLRLLLETGRESADRLSQFLGVVDRANIAVNFDPANFVVYGSDEPVRAVVRLKGLIDLVHLKDAKRSFSPGREFGAPAPFGSGDAEVARIVSKLRTTGYRGPLLLECDTRTGGLDLLRGAAEYLRSMFA